MRLVAPKACRSLRPSRHNTQRNKRPNNSNASTQNNKNRDSNSKSSIYIYIYSYSSITAIMTAI